MDTRQVNVTYHREDGVWWAESDDMPGFSAAGDTFAETRKNVWEGVDFYFNDHQRPASPNTLTMGPRFFPTISCCLIPIPGCALICPFRSLCPPMLRPS